MSWKESLRWARILAGLLLTAFLYRTAVRSSALVEESADIVTIRLEDQKLDAAGAKEIQRQELSAEEPLELNCWGEAGKTEVESVGNSQRAVVNLLYTGEKANLVVPGTEILSWKEEGCFLDKETAADLFGSEQAAGQTVRCGDRKYTVCGTFESFRSLMLCRARQEDGAVLTMISCRSPELSGAASRAQEFLMRRNLAGECMDFTFLAYLSYDLQLLLPVCLGIRLLQMISGIAARQTSSREQSEDPPGKEKRIPPVFFRCLQLVLILIIFLFVWKSVRIPSDMIPSRWSEFSFWGTWWEKQRENLLLLIRAAQGEAQSMLLWNFCRAVCADAGAAVCLLLCMY